MLNELYIPEYWLTGLGSWAVSYLLHSSVILGCVLLLTHRSGFFSESHKDVMLKIGLVAGILTASIQFVQSSNGIAVSTIEVPLAERQVLLDEQHGRILATHNLQLLVPNQSPADKPQTKPISWLKVIVLCWFVGCVLFAVRFIWQWRQFNRQTGVRHELTHQPTVMLCRQLTNNMGIRRKIKLTCSAQIASPMAIGLSQVCIPDKLWDDVDEEQLTAIIAHELAHLARTDPLWLFFWHILGIVFFFQPLNKLAQWSFQARAEFLADAAAVRQTKDPVAMVNSLMSAAKLVNGRIRGNMSASLLGNNANILTRAHMLLQENPLKTRTSMPVIILSAVVMVAVSSYFLPTVSLSGSNVVAQMPDYGSLGQHNAKPWTMFSSSRLNYKVNLDYSRSFAGVGQLMRTNLIYFDYDLDGIAQIQPFGHLRFASQNIYRHEYLVIESDYRGEVWFQYSVNGERVDDQRQAMAFIRVMLDNNFAQSDAFKRKMLRLYSAPSSQDNITKFAMRFNRFKQRQDLSAADQAVLQLFQRHAQLFTQGQGYSAQSGLRFFNAMAHHGDLMAAFNDFGYLAISDKRAKPGSEAVQYNLNNIELLQIFAQARGEQYVPGTTEKALVHFLVRLHFNVTEAQIRWIEE